MGVEVPEIQIFAGSTSDALPSRLSNIPIGVLLIVLRPDCSSTLTQGRRSALAQQLLRRSHRDGLPLLPAAGANSVVQHFNRELLPVAPTAQIGTQESGCLNRSELGRGRRCNQRADDHTSRE